MTAQDDLSQEGYAKRIVRLAVEKGWGNDTIWLMYGCHKEIAELHQTIENYKAKKLRFKCPKCNSPTDTVSFNEVGICDVCRATFIMEEIRKMYIELVGSEFAGAMHFIDQLMKKEAPECNLDNALNNEINLNYQRAKKTYIKGEIVRK